MSLNDEVRRAERLIATIDANLKKWQTWFPNGESCVDVPRDDLLALAKFAQAYLAQQRADDDEPVTEEWLRSLSTLVSDGDWWCEVVLMNKARTADTGSIRYSRMKSGQVAWYINGSLMNPSLFATRGQVRKLLEALGVGD